MARELSVHASRSALPLFLEKKLMATPVFGIPYLILLVEAISLGLYLAFRRGIEGTRLR